MTQTDGERSGHTGDGALRTVDVNALSAEEGAVDAADALDKQEPVFVDVRDHEAKFVDVAGKDNVRLFVRIPQTSECVAVGIGGEFVAVRFYVVGEDALRAGFESGRRRRGDEIFEELERCFVHRRTMQTGSRGGKTSTGENPSGTMFPRR